MPAKDTEQLKNELTCADDVKKFIVDNAENLNRCNLVKYLEHLLAEKNLSRSQVIKNSNLGEYAHHIFAGRKKTSRKNILSLAVAMNLSPKETDYLLYYAGHKKLYPRNDWDIVIFFALENHKTILETNDILTSLKLYPLLGKFD